MKTISKSRTLVQRLRENSKMAALIDQERAALNLEIQFEEQLHRTHQTAAQLAKKVGAARSSVSRDLSGGICRAKLERVAALAAALDCDALTLLIPRDANARRAKVDQVRKLLCD